MAKQNYEVRWTPDGAAHVEAHHKTAPWTHGVLGPKGHAKWARSVAGAEIAESEGACRCGMQLGQFRKRSGQTYIDPGFGDKPKGPRAAKPVSKPDEPAAPEAKKPAKKRPAKKAAKPSKKPAKKAAAKAAKAAKAAPAKAGPSKLKSLIASVRSK